MCNLVQLRNLCPDNYTRVISSEGFTEHSIQIFNEEVKLTVKMENINKQIVTLLIDTGAQVSFLCYKDIENKNKINHNLIMNVRGAISGLKSTTLGTICSGIYINDIFYPHTFHVIDDCISVGNANGVIGSDFLKKFECILNFSNDRIELIKPQNIKENTRMLTSNHSRNPPELEKEKTKTIYSKDRNTNLCLHDNSRVYDGHINSGTELSTQHDNLYDRDTLQNQGWLTTVPTFRRLRNFDKVILKARTENIILFPIENKNDVVVENKELANGIFLGNSIEKPMNGFIKLAIINANENDFTLNKSNINACINALSNYDIITDKICPNEDSNRRKTLANLINLSHCNTEERDKILKICLKFNKVFHLKGDKLSSTNATTHRIPLTPNTVPINTKPYRLPYYQKETLEKEIQMLLDDKVIQPSQSPWCSPILLVPKKADETGKRKWRLCIDFRNVNIKTITDAYPLPNITDILDQLGNSIYFSTLDLERGYWQVEMDEKDREITAFKANGKLYEWLRMPMGVKNAAPTFQRMMNNILTGLQGEMCLVYIDDLVIYGKSLLDHNNKLEAVLNRLSKFKLKVNPQKCNFLHKEINFLGHIVSKSGITPDQRKIAAIIKYPVPKTQREIKSFLGLVSYYRKFIDNFAKIARPINNLLRKDAIYNWDINCEKAFSTLKEKLTTAPILIHPDFNKQFIIRTDASHYASGAVLSQGEIKFDLPIAFMSKTFNKHEVRYATVEKELLAIIHALRFFRPYVFGRKCLIITDHQALVWIMKLKNPASRLMRWKMELAEYDFEIIHRPGIFNSAADALSRIDISKELLLSLDPIPNKTELKYDKTLNITTRSRERNENRSQINPVIAPETIDSNVSIKEIDILHHKFLHDVETYHVYVLTNAFTFPYVYVEDYTIFNHQPGKIVELSENSIALYNSDSISQDEQKQIWNSIKDTLSAKKFKKMCIFISQSEYNLYNTVKCTILKIFKGSSIEIFLIYNKIIILEEKEDQEVVIKSFHDSILGGHLGIQATIDKIQKQYFWNGMGKDIKKYINNCITCKTNKITTHTKMPMHITTTATMPFEKIIMDCVGPITESKLGNRFMVTFQDDLTKYAECVATPNITAFTVAKAFIENVVCKHSLPKTLLTDNGSNFMSEMFQEVCRVLKINHVTSTVAHPQTVGQIERYHRTLGQYLKIFTEENKDEWDELIPFALFTYNTTKHSSTHFSPHYLVYGFDVEIPSNLKSNPTPVYNYENYVSVLKNRLKTAHEIAKKNIKDRKETNKKYFDTKLNPITFKIGDSVLLYKETKTHKFDSPYEGPFTIVDIPNEENCIINYKRKNKKVHKNKLKLV